MISKRPFRPWFICAIGSHFIAIDQIQPIAITISQTGELINISSWADQASPIATKRRVVAANENHAFVTDWSTSATNPEPISTVALGADKVTGHLTPAEIPHSDVPLQPRRNRRSSTHDLTHTIEEAHNEWTFRSNLTNWTWNSDVSYLNEGMSLPGPANITSQATIGKTAAISVQKSNKRPWQFQPESEVQIITATNCGLTRTKVPAVNIEELCWSRQRNDHEVRREIGNYLDFTYGQMHSAAEMGARNIEMIMNSTGLDVAIDIRFTFESHPEATFSRRDIPFDEVGNIAGLRAQNIFLDEDIDSGLLDSISPDHGTVTYI